MPKPSDCICRTLFLDHTIQPQEMCECDRSSTASEMVALLYVDPPLAIFLISVAINQLRVVLELRDNIAVFYYCGEKIITV